MEHEPWIQTFTGKRFTPLNPKIEDIDIKDIAHALSNICRFTGHSNFFYSVAQHCVLVSSLVNDKHKLSALLHDASESYISDISTPLKKSPVFAEYRKLEKQLSEMIYRKFGVPEIEADEVKLADSIALSTEATNLLDLRPDWILAQEPLDIKIIPLSPPEAEKLFLETFTTLYEKQRT